MLRSPPGLEAQKGNSKTYLFIFNYNCLAGDLFLIIFAKNGPQLTVALLWNLSYRFQDTFEKVLSKDTFGISPH